MTAALQETRPREMLPRAEAAATNGKRVVIIGGGFAGIAATRALRRCNAEVVLIDRRNHHIFQPLLYQVATATLSPADIAAPIRQLGEKQKNLEVVLAEVDIGRFEITPGQRNRPHVRYAHDPVRFLDCRSRDAIQLFRP